MSYTKKHYFDERVVDNIRDYMCMNNYSTKRLAQEAGFTYNQLYQILKKNQLIKLKDYLKICNALQVSFDRFINDGIDINELM